MNFKVVTIPDFDRALKKLVKKYASLAREVAELGDSLAEEPFQGTPIGKNCYKIRLAIKSKGQGKSGGARVITCVVAVEERVILLSIYDKSEQETITDKELQRLLDSLPK
jgi:hypothetical protein